MITNLYAKFLGDYYFGVNRNRNFKYISDEKIYKKYA